MFFCFFGCDVFLLGFCWQLDSTNKTTPNNALFNKFLAQFTLLTMNLSHLLPMNVESLPVINHRYNHKTLVFLFHRDTENTTPIQMAVKPINTAIFL